MLTADLIRPRLDTHAEEITTRPLSLTDAQTVGTAGDLLQIFAEHVGSTRGELIQALEEYEGARLDYVIIRGLSKVLLDAAQFTTDPPVEPASLREHLFTQAAERGPIYPGRTLPKEAAAADHFPGSARHPLIKETAAHFRISQKALEAAFYADLTEEQILEETGQTWDATDLLTRYNLELARGLLYWASEMEIFARGGYKDLFKYLKLFKLMHEIRPFEDGYRIRVDGPISPFVQSTLRYGAQMALFLPGLMLCTDWAMRAIIHDPQPGSRRIYRYRLDPSSGLVSHYRASAEFDSRLESDFATEFEAKFGQKRKRWILDREDEIVPVGDSVMIPDFSFTHNQDGRRALVELAGFWHPDYLKRKAWKLRSAGREDIVLVAYQSVNTTDETWKDVPGEVLLFTRKPVIKDVMAAVERSARVPAGE